ncbi:MAG: ADP-ribosylglycohydrolase family protein [Verrucomicrobiota bacterium]
MRTHDERLETAREILDGLSVGDALGEALSYQHHRARDIADFSMFRPGTVPYTDDTEMALAIFETLTIIRGIDEDAVAWAYSSRYRRTPDRGYGKMARRILDSLCTGSPWREVSMNAFGGGSFGNGAAMRVAPLGGYFADDLNIVPEAAARSARVTHFHPEGIAGAIAVAVATAVAFASRQQSATDACHAIWDAVLDFTPESKVRTRISRARQMLQATSAEVAHEVGNGTEISAWDTVPFCIWSACRNLHDFREAFLSTVEVGGDCDTNCAIVGGIVAGYVGSAEIPEDWIRAREPLQLNR